MLLRLVPELPRSRRKMPATRESAGGVVALGHSAFTLPVVWVLLG